MTSASTSLGNIGTPLEHGASLATTNMHDKETEPIENDQALWYNVPKKDNASWQHQQVLS